VDGHPPADVASSHQDPGSASTAPALSPSLEREAHELILEAFSRAKRSGKPDWREMTTAVLKNRLLQITSHSFDLERYDAGSVRELVANLPRLVDYIEPPGPGRPGLVVLKAGQLEDDDTRVAGAEASAGSTRQSVRADLWRAAMDWAEHVDYVLDPATGHARRRLESDPADLPSIQRIPKETYLAWRQQFIDEALAHDLSSDERAAVEGWRESAGPSRVLPRHVQDAWMSLLRARVREHLARWFDAQGLDAPPDLIGNAARGSLSKAPALGLETAISVARLRETIQRCVREMTYEELRRLNIPSEVVARVITR